MELLAGFLRACTGKGREKAQQPKFEKPTRQQKLNALKRNPGMLRELAKSERRSLNVDPKESIPNYRDLNRR